MSDDGFIAGLELPLEQDANGEGLTLAAVSGRMARLFGTGAVAQDIDRVLWLRRRRDPRPESFDPLNCQLRIA
jgi:hypothetical protein